MILISLGNFAFPLVPQQFLTTFHDLYPLQEDLKAKKKKNKNIVVNNHLHPMPCLKPAKQLLATGSDTVFHAEKSKQAPTATGSYDRRK